MAFIDSFSDCMNDTASIIERTWVPDGLGGGSYTNSVIATIQCGIWQNSANERLVSERVHDYSTHTLVCEPNSLFTADMIIQVSGQTYKISRPDDIMNFGDGMQIKMELVQ